MKLHTNTLALTCLLFTVIGCGGSGGGTSSGPVNAFAATYFVSDSTLDVDIVSRVDPDGKISLVLTDGNEIVDEDDVVVYEGSGMLSGAGTASVTLNPVSRAEDSFVASVVGLGSGEGRSLQLDLSGKRSGRVSMLLKRGNPFQAEFDGDFQVTTGPDAGADGAFLATINESGRITIDLGAGVSGTGTVNGLGSASAAASGSGASGSVTYSFTGEFYFYQGRQYGRGTFSYSQSGWSGTGTWLMSPKTEP